MNEDTNIQEIYTTTTNVGWITRCNSTNSLIHDNFKTKLPEKEKENFLDNILDGLIRLSSLTKKSLYETFVIKKINFSKKQTKIVCKKQIDLQYLEDLKKESIFLNELIDDNLYKYVDKYGYDINMITDYITYGINGTPSITLSNNTNTNHYNYYIDTNTNNTFTTYTI